MQYLKVGQSVRAEASGIDCRVEQLLGSGGQGEVYRVRAGDRPLALKWYFSHTATPGQREVLEGLVKVGPPSPQFLWPFDLVSAPGLPGFGYLMPLRDSRYKDIPDLMKRRVDVSFTALSMIGMNLAHAFLQLHSKGLCYQDISDGNVFFEPKQGDILICDNDNVTVNGQDSGTILGTPRFMAPEIVRREAHPSRQTDLFSLSVLLFNLLMQGHPLHGAREAAIRCMDEPAMTSLYGTDPVFIFDPENATNRPIAGYHQNPQSFWPIYPSFLKVLFTRAFTEGLHNPQHGRVQESEWRMALARLRDSIVHCQSCQAQNPIDLEITGPQKPASCWRCNKEICLPMHMKLEKRVVYLNGDTHLFPHHVDSDRLYDFGLPVAQVTRHPQNPGLWGLKNLSGDAWMAITTDGNSLPIEPGKNVRLSPGTRIQFGKVEASIGAS